jgi:hypothetical protein
VLRRSAKKVEEAERRKGGGKAEERGNATALVTHRRKRSVRADHGRDEKGREGVHLRSCCGFSQKVDCMRARGPNVSQCSTKFGPQTGINPVTQPPPLRSANHSASSAKNRQNKAKKKAGINRPFYESGEPIYLTCLPIRPAISNIDTCALPKTARSFSSALIMRLLTLSCRFLDLM